MLTPNQMNAALGCIPGFGYWQIQRSWLDRIVGESAKAHEAHLVAAALASIDAMYGGGLWRRREYRWHRMIEHVVQTGHGLRDKLHRSKLEDTPLDALGEDDLPEIVGMHNDLASLSDNGEEVVVASKYLHFSYPRIFPIWDSVVVDYLRVRSVRCSVYEDLVHWYWQSLRDNWTKPIRDWNGVDGELTTSVRTLDMVAWLVGTAARWRAICRGERAGGVNREVRKYFEQDAKLVDDLLGT